VGKDYKTPQLNKENATDRSKLVKDNNIHNNRE